MAEIQASRATNMNIQISLPDEFEEHFKLDAFQDSLARIKCDIDTYGCLSGLYEIELIDALKAALLESWMEKEL